MVAERKSVKRKVLQVFLLQIMLLIPWGVMAQEQKVTIHLKQVKVQEIFKEILVKRAKLRAMHLL